MSGDARLLGLMLAFKDATVDLLASWASITSSEEPPILVGDRNGSDGPLVGAGNGGDAELTVMTASSNTAELRFLD